MTADKMPYIIYVDLLSLIKKVNACANNSEKTSTIKIGKHVPSGYSLSAIWEFYHIENKYTLYRGEDCTKTFCESLR